MKNGKKNMLSYLQGCVYRRVLLMQIRYKGYRYPKTSTGNLKILDCHENFIKFLFLLTPTVFWALIKIRRVLNYLLL